LTNPTACKEAEGAVGEAIIKTVLFLANNSRPRAVPANPCPKTKKSNFFSPIQGQKWNDFREIVGGY
jgi:hypothetical protein